VSDAYELIDAEKATKTETGEKKYTITTMCSWLGVSTSGYYDWCDRPESATTQRRASLAVVIKKIFEGSDATYGHRRVHAQLVRQSEAATPELVRSIMRELDLVACQPRGVAAQPD
jgi:putative transposase